MKRIISKLVSFKFPPFIVESRKTVGISIIITLSLLFPYNYSKSKAEVLVNFRFPKNFSINHFLLEGEKFNGEEHITHDIAEAPPKKPIANFAEYLECFDPNKGATITIYIKQPIANSNWPLLIPSFASGHCFVTFAQDDEFMSFGFYPVSGAGYWFSTEGIMGDNSLTEYHLSITKEVDASVFSEALNYSINFSKLNYDLQLRNCTDFGLVIAEVCGFGIQESNSSSLWSIVAFPNPAKLGEFIRNMELPEGVSRNIEGGVSPINKRSCD